MTPRHAHRKTKWTIVWTQIIILLLSDFSDSFYTFKKSEEVCKINTKEGVNCKVNLHEEEWENSNNELKTILN